VERRVGSPTRADKDRAFFDYANRFGHVLIDLRLYLPKECAEDEARRTT